MSGVPGGIEKALSSTIRRANNTVRSETLKGITTVYAITRQNVRAETTIKVRTQSSDGGIVGTVLFAGHKIPLYRFNVSPTIPIQRATVSAAGDEATQEPQDGEESTTGDSDTEPPAEDAQEVAPEGYGLFVYAGPSLPHGRLKEHAVFNGTFEDVKAYLADVLEDYPQAERLIVPVERLSAFAAKVKTPGNIAHKYYNDIVSTMRGNKEV